MISVHFNKFDSLYSSVLASVNPVEKAKQRAKIERLTQEFLANGGEIDRFDLIRLDDKHKQNKQGD